LLLEKVGRGEFKLAPRGSEALTKNPARIDNAYLRQFPEFQTFKSKRNAKAIADGEDAEGHDAAENLIATPDERLVEAYEELRETLATDLLEKVRGGTDKFFEHLVVDLLVAMGYGGSQSDRGRVVGKSGDGGIDGVIQEDQLGLDMVYIQAKKWQNPVGPDEIRKFVGSLGEQKAHKGVFITSGAYTDGARKAAERANAKVVLIDGEQLAQLMIDHGVGVADQKAYVIKKLDSDYFDGV
jgi:restriction system protein